MWHLIFLFFNIMNILTLIYPFLIKFDLRLNVLKLKGSITILIFNKIKFNFKIRVKNGYIYLYFKKKEKKLKISRKNINFVFLITIFKQIYLRHQLLNFDFKSNFGYNPDSCVTATTCGAIDVFVKSILGKIKNNKKSAHIFVSVEPKYNEDIFNIRIVDELRMSIFDIIYTFVYSIIYVWRDYEKNGKYKPKKRQKN